MKTRITTLRTALLLSFLFACSGCFSMRDEYAFMASQYIRSGNQLPYVNAVKAMDATSYSNYSYCQPCVTRYELPSEQGSILITTPSASN